MLLVLSLGSAFASTPVVYSGVQGDGRVLRDEGLSDLEWLSLGDLRTRPPLVEGASLSACTGTPYALARVIALVQEAEGHLAYIDHVKAGAALAEARAALPCVTTAVDKVLLTRVWFLSGFTALGKGDGAAARAAFDRLFLVDPSSSWDPALPPDETGVFEEARAAIAGRGAVRLDLHPLGPGVTALIDGAAVGTGAMVTPGPHLLTLLTQQVVSYEIDVTGPTSVVMPALIPLDGLDWVADPALAPELVAVLDGVLGPGALAVQTSQAVWLRRAGSDAFEAIALPDPEGSGRKRLRWATISGSVLTLSGVGVMAAASGRAAAEVADATETRDREAYSQAKAAYDEAQRVHGAGTIVALGGFTLTGIGLFAPLELGPLDVVVAPSVVGLSWELP